MAVVPPPARPARRPRTLAFSAAPTWRSRWERGVLRWQARLDTEAVDRVLPWLMALVLGGALAGLALARAYSLQAGAPLALFNQSIWHVGRGFTPESTLVGGNYLAQHGSFIIYPLSVLTRWLPTTTTLLALQSGALALGLVPLWRIARRRADLKVAPAGAVAFAYACYAAVHNANLADFHPETLALPALLGAVYYGLGARWLPFGTLVVVVLACRSDLGWVVGVLGLVLANELRATGGGAAERPPSERATTPLLSWTPARVGRSLLSIGGRHSRTALIWAFAALLWVLVSTETLQPLLAGGEFPHLARYRAYGDASTAEVLWGILRQPHVFLGNLFTRENFLVGVALLAPVLFLPLLELRYLMPAVPLFTLQLASDTPDGLLVESLPVAAFVLVATTFALRRAGAVLVRRVRVNRRLVVTLLLATAIFFVRDAASSPFHAPWRWSRDVADAERLAAVEVIPDQAAVRASAQLLPLLAERNVLFELEVGGASASARADARSSAEGVGWIAFDLASAPDWRDDALEIERFDTTLRQQGWERAFTTAQVRVYRYEGPGAPPIVG